MTENEKKERLEKQFRFLEEVDKEKQIFRQTYLADGKRKENDAEHAWHLALMTALLSEYANEPIDVLKTMGMVLFHDVVEIDAGDTYAYDEDGKKTQAQREQKAAWLQHNLKRFVFRRRNRHLFCFDSVFDFRTWQRGLFFLSSFDKHNKHDDSGDLCFEFHR